MISPIQSICSLTVFYDRDRNGPDKPPFDPDDCDSSDRPDRTALCQGLIRPQQEPIWAPVPSRLLSFVGGHGTVAGGYYGTSAKGTMGRIEGIGRDVVSPFPSFPSPTAGNFHVHPYNKRRLGTSQCQRRSAIVIVSNALTHFDTTGLSADDDLNGLTETNPSP